MSGYAGGGETAGTLEGRLENISHALLCSGSRTLLSGLGSILVSGQVVLALGTAPGHKGSLCFTSLLAVPHCMLGWCKRQVGPGFPPGD